MKIWLFVGLMAIVGCKDSSKIVEIVDEIAFIFLGGTVLSSPEQISLKEVHLDPAGWIGRRVIVEGQLKKNSDSGTYMVISDELASLLIVTTEVKSRGQLKGWTQDQAIRILGKLETGRKGLLLLRADVIAEGTKTQHTDRTH